MTTTGRLQKDPSIRRSIYGKKAAPSTFAFWRAPERLVRRTRWLVSWARLALAAARRVASKRERSAPARKSVASSPKDGNQSRPPRGRILASAVRRLSPCRCRRPAEELIAHRTSSPDTPVPAASRALSKTSPVCGSIPLNSLSSPSQVRAKFPSIQGPGDEAVGLDGASMACFGIDLMILRSRILPHPERASARPRPESTAGPAGAGIVRAHGRCLDRSSGCDLRDLKQVRHRRRFLVGCDINRAQRLPLSPVEGVSLSPAANQTC